MLLLLAFSSVFLQNQEFSIDERLRVDFVRLDVAVRDRSGNPVTGLTLADFEVKENGKKVKPTFFEIIDYRPQSERKAVPSENAPNPSADPVQQIIIALDLSSAKPLEIRKTMSQLREFLNELPGRTRYLINLYSLEFGSLTGGFANGKEKAMDAFSELERRYLAAARGESRSELIKDREKEKFRVERFRVGRAGGLFKPINNLNDLEIALKHCELYRDARHPADIRRCVYETVARFLEEHEWRTKQALGQLESLAYHFQKTEGPKMMFLVSPGFVLNGLEAPRLLAEQLYPQMDQPIVDSQTDIDLWPPRPYDLRKEFRRVVHACTRNRVVFYAIDVFNQQNLKGRTHSAEFKNISVKTKAFHEAYWQNITQGTRRLADQSGGDFLPTLHVKGPIQNIIDKNQYFYVVGYASPAGKPGRFRRIKVKAKVKRAKLHYRGGYFGR